MDCTSYCPSGFDVPSPKSNWCEDRTNGQTNWIVFATGPIPQTLTFGPETDDTVKFQSPSSESGLSTPDWSNWRGLHFYGVHAVDMVDLVLSTSFSMRVWVKTFTGNLVNIQLDDELVSWAVDLPSSNP
jgi:hypothetical protein